MVWRQDAQDRICACPQLGGACVRCETEGPSTNVKSEPAAVPSALFFFDVTYFNSSPDVYQIPLAVSTGAALEDIAESQPESIIAKLTTSTGPAILYDATVSEDFQHELLSLIASDATLPVLEGGKSTETATGASIRRRHSKIKRRLSPSVRQSCQRRSALSPVRRLLRHEPTSRPHHQLEHQDSSRASLLLQVIRFLKVAVLMHVLPAPFRLCWPLSGYLLASALLSNRIHPSFTASNCSSKFIGDCSRRRIPMWKLAVF